MFNNQKRILGNSGNNIIQFTNKDKKNILYNDEFNRILKKGIWEGLSLYNDPIKDSSLYLNLNNDTKKNLINSDFDLGNKIIKESTSKKLNSNDILDIGYNKVKNDTNEVVNNVKNFGNDIKNFGDNMLNYIKDIPIGIAVLIILLIAFKK